MKYRAMHGLPVIDYSLVLAGSCCTMLLAYLGADMYKIEEPGGGDMTGQWGPSWMVEEEWNGQY